MKLIGDGAMFAADDAVADEGSVVVDEAVRARAAEAFDAERLPPRALKGFGAETVAYRVRRRAT